MVCGVHGIEMKLIPAGVSKKTGRPYNAFYACTVDNCKWKPEQSTQGGWEGVRQAVAQRVAPEKAVMTKEDWEEKERRTNKNILLQVAFKAAVELCAHGQIGIAAIEEKAIAYHKWLLSQTEGQTPAVGQKFTPTVHGDDIPPIESYEGMQ